jgi:hypothetical protein
MTVLGIDGKKHSDKGDKEGLSVVEEVERAKEKGESEHIRGCLMI